MRPAVEARADSVLADGRVRYSKRMLSHLAVGHQLLPGSRVLELGCGTGELTRALHALSLDVTAYERCTESVRLAMRELPEVEFRYWKHDQQYLGGDREFDLVLFHGGDELLGDLLSEPTLRMTAGLAGCVHPGGALVFLIRNDPTWDDLPGGHLPSCYSRLLSRFPGTVKTRMFPDSLTDRRTWNWMLGRQPRSGFLMISLQVPDQPNSQFQWRQLIERETRRPQEPCCLWARRETAEEIPLQRAA